MDFKKLNHRAWKIRREAALDLNCNVLEVSWKECLELAKEQIKSIENHNKAAKRQANITFSVALCIVLISLFACYLGIDQSHNKDISIKLLCGSFMGVAVLMPLSIIFIENIYSLIYKTKKI
jgi:hypothetical protein